MKILGSLLGCYFLLCGLLCGQDKPMIKEKLEDYVLMVDIIPNKDDKGNVIPVDASGRKRLIGQIGERIDAVGNLNAEIKILENGKIKLTFPKTPEGRKQNVFKQLTKTGKLTIHSVHPLGAKTKLAKSVFDGEYLEPGYKAVVEESVEGNGKITKQYYLIKRKAALSGTDIEGAFPDKLSESVVNIRLTIEGGKKMTDFTSSLKIGDMIATVLDGKVISAATLRSETLGRNFQISGQKSMEESEALAGALMVPFEYQLQVAEVKK